jgi:Domain of unknown function (DUF4386)
MKQNQLIRFGGTFAILLGIARLFSSVIYIFLSPDLRAEVPASSFLPAFAQNASPLITFFWIEALVGFLGVAVVPAFSALVQNEEEGWVRWTGNLATAGFVVTAVGYTLSIAKLPGIAAAFVAGDPSTQAALAAVWKSSIDLFGLWGYGAVGLWVLVINILFLRGSKFPQFLSYLGILLAILFLLVPLGTILKNQTILLITAGGGAIAGPIWWIWSGWILRGSSASA